MLRMSVCMHSRFVENHSIWILEDGPLISEVLLLHGQWRATGGGRQQLCLAHGGAGDGPPELGFPGALLHQTRRGFD
jgi:hypothetical protein